MPIPMPSRAIVPAIMTVALAIPSGAAASQQFAGRWKRTSHSLTVKTDSWGENCGPAPKSYGSKKIVDVDVAAQGKHLVFSKFGIRTDRCISLNPKLSTISESAASGNWSRVCQTPQNDPKFERLESNLAAQGNNKLVYSAKSKYDWTLKGDHCVAHITEKQVFVREGSEPVAEEEPKAPPKKTIDTDIDIPSDPECEAHGPLKRLTIHPKEAKIGPGERVCFKATGVDADGCRFPVSASWTATQDGQEVGGLLARGGCFSAGATAAESEGTYDITAKIESKTAEATVTVAFPDLGDLLAARLRPADDLADLEPPDGGTQAPSGTGPAAAALAQTPAASTPPPRADRTMLIIIVVAAGMLVAVGLLVVALVLRRRPRRTARHDDDWLDDPVAVAPPPRDAPLRAPDSAPTPAPDPATKPTRDLREQAPAQGDAQICPTCCERFPASARFCPLDGSSLIPAPLGSGFYPTPGSDAGMVCPACHRGYDAGARFCPHDSAKLVPYSEWREIHRAKR
jgi:hypothetical protein